MLLVDALHINNSGGLVLLDYLIKSIEKCKINAFYLLDDRLVNNYPKIEYIR